MTNPSKTGAQDPVCGMTVDPGTARHMTRDGKTFYFCCEPCRQAFRLMPSNSNSKSKSG